MQSHLQLVGAAVALAIGTASGRAASAECPCQASSCATVEINTDNWTDLGCQREQIGQQLTDSDADGIPDVCDACACSPNPPDPDTGVIPHCLEAPGLEAPGLHAQPIQCEGGQVAGLPAHSDLFFVRPTSWLFTRFESGSTVLVGGAQLLWVRNLDVESCEAVDVGGIPSTKLTSPTLWYSRGALFIEAGSNLSEFSFDAAVGVKLGVDYAPPDSWLSVGPTLHVATLFPSAEPTPLFVGLGPRIGLLDLVAFTPFAQLDTLEGKLSYGAWLEFEWGIFEDVGLTRRKLLALLPRVPN